MLRLRKDMEKLLTLFLGAKESEFEKRGTSLARAMFYTRLVLLMRIQVQQGL